jgi:hypothetical protein
MLGLKYSDQLARLSVSLHVVNCVLEQMLGKMLKTEIPRDFKADSRGSTASSRSPPSPRQNELIYEENNVKFVSNPDIDGFHN